MERQCSKEHLFFECSFAQILIKWVFFQLLRVVPDATPFTVREPLFGFSGRCIRKLIKWILLVVKHQIWVSRCDFRFRDIPPDEAKCLKIVIARIKFLLRVLASESSSSSQKRAIFEQKWLSGGILGQFSDKKLVFPF